MVVVLDAAKLEKNAEAVEYTEKGIGEAVAPNRPLGARGPMTGREFDSTQAGGPVRQLSTGRIKVTDRGIDALERHIGRFGNDDANQVMVDRLRRIARGEIEPTQYDLNHYSHELREFVRYRRQGFPTGAGDDYDLWNNAHTATLEDYGLRELDANRNRNLFHPDAWPFLPR
ncbi:MAG: colicin [Isosphaeraceae bacterium]